MTIQNFDYYRQRADEELAAAECADDPAIAMIHRDMARRYRQLMKGDPDRVGVDGAPVQGMGGASAQPGPVFG